MRRSPSIGHSIKLVLPEKIDVTFRQRKGAFRNEITHCLSVIERTGSRKPTASSPQSVKTAGDNILQSICGNGLAHRRHSKSLCRCCLVYPEAAAPALLPT